LRGWWLLPGTAGQGLGVAGQALAQLVGARPVATAWCSRPGRLRPVGAVAQPGHSWPGLWRGHYVAWEVAVDRRRGVASRGWAATWHGRPGLPTAAAVGRWQNLVQSVECKGKTQISMQCSGKSCLVDAIGVLFKA
jgi:hypothetical protein